MADENQEADLLAHRAGALGIAEDVLEDAGRQSLLAMDEGTFGALQGEMENISPALRAGVINTGAGEYFLAIRQKDWVPSWHVEAFAMAFPGPHVTWPEIGSLQESGNPGTEVYDLIRSAINRLYAEECAKVFPNDIVAPLDEVKHLLRGEVRDELRNKSLESMVENGELNIELITPLLKRVKEEKAELENLAIVYSVLKEELDASDDARMRVDDSEERKHLKELENLRCGLAYYIVDDASNRGVLQNETKDGLNPNLVKALKNVWALNEELLKTVDKQLEEKVDGYNSQLETSEKEAKEKIKELEKKLEGDFKKDALVFLKDAGIDLDERLPKQVGSSGQSPDAKDKGGKDAEEKAGLKKFMNAKSVIGAAIVATVALVAALVMKNGDKDKQPSGRAI